MNAAEESIQCAWCGRKIPPKIDPRGRKARYCSGACRAAAARERARTAHQAELKRAQERAQERAQDSFVLGNPSEILATVVTEIDATTRLIRDRGEVPGSCTEMVNAARALVAAAEQPAPQALTRQQRRRLEREQKKTR